MTGSAAFFKMKKIPELEEEDFNRNGSAADMDEHPSINESNFADFTDLNREMKYKKQNCHNPDARLYRGNFFGSGRGS